MMSPTSVIAELNSINGIRILNRSAKNAHPHVQIILNKYGGAQSRNTTAVESTIVPRIICMKYANA
jgi:ribosomal protein S7